ncbi:HNH endonuclease [Defluviimonas sp. D31]|uniref:HNH endonuclease n=1 Tax=Defluviimonas sp. D31 TaxID=3083253 RepID=UPI00296F572B|nr:HNH endonuclease [Defluviimonas sp. D31]MDW4548403.1 HNH endonuclease [Defluviimonas sp. D31]
MTTLADLLSRISGEHRSALDWFNARKGNKVSWSDIKAHAENDARLVAQAKGIYKPHYTHYALSVRTLADGPYPDKEVEYRSDGSWVTQYFQENPDSTLRDREATNRGLMACMEDSVPVGFLIKRKPKPGVTYEVLGLGLVTDWTNGYFTIEGFADDGEAHTGAGQHDAAQARARAATSASDPAEHFDVAASEDDLREQVISQVARRRGQARFRAELLEAYEGRCCISGCDFTEALEAAHIAPYRGPQSNHPQNGLLLRADLHTLFDLGHLAISENFRVVLSSKAKASAGFSPFDGQPISVPQLTAQQPSREALRRHRDWSGL